MPSGRGERARDVETARVALGLVDVERGEDGDQDADRVRSRRAPSASRATR